MSTNYIDGDVATEIARKVHDKLLVANPLEGDVRQNVLTIAIALVDAYTAGVVAGVRRNKPPASARQGTPDLTDRSPAVGGGVV